ncbi:MAG TPA: hypothetical protein VFO35_06830 [Steroidobacteraceae bacterium]|nr:hypothetical protein [Steroidobacteraceae bacterium]
MRALRSLLACTALLAAVASAHAGALAELEVYDRTAGRTLPIYEHEGRLYVAGEPKHQYELRIRNSSAGRLLAVTSVDGVNVISGETAAQQQSGYVLGSWDSVRIEGWRKNLDEVATFYFTRLADSYAARTGRPNDVGVIGLALFREHRPYHRPCCGPYLEDRTEDRAAAPSAAAESSVREADDAELQGNASGSSQRRSESKLGTGHGHREASPAQYVDFKRASSTPDETIVIYYDSRKNLVAQGVLPQPHRRYADRRPDPFPNGFVPDP